VPYWGIAGQCGLCHLKAQGGGNVKKVPLERRVFVSRVPDPDLVKLDDALSLPDSFPARQESWS
jgi:hypothetical protein